MLFERARKFKGLPARGFEVFAVSDREARRRAIVEEFHPALALLGQDLTRQQSAETEHPLHVHLPRLDWPPGYEPFCTWLALSREAHGYQAGPQLNVGVHADHVSVRLGWDTAADAFGRFEFLGRCSDLGAGLVAVAREGKLTFRVYSSARWPQGSRCVFESSTDLPGSFDEIQRHGVWWELGRRYDWPDRRRLVCSEALGSEVEHVFQTLLPTYDRLTL